MIQCTALQVLFGLQLQKHRVIQTEQPQESVQTERFTGPDCSPEFLLGSQIVPAQTWYIMGHHETSWEIMRHSHTWSQPELTERKPHNFASRWWFWSGLDKAGSSQINPLMSTWKSKRPEVQTLQRYMEDPKLNHHMNLEEPQFFLTPKLKSAQDCTSLGISPLRDPNWRVIWAFFLIAFSLLRVDFPTTFD